MYFAISVLVDVQGVMNVSNDIGNVVIDLKNLKLCVMNWLI